MRYARFPKLGIVVDCDSHLILAASPSRGPTPDVHQLEVLLKQLPRGLRIDRMLLDAGYDSEANHQRLRDERNILSDIPPKIGRPTNKPAKGAHRRHMQRTLTDAGRKRVRFGQRWQVETVFSMIKRNLDHTVAGRKYWSQCRDLLLLCITHNVMIALRGGFSTEQIYPIWYQLRLRCPEDSRGFWWVEGHAVGGC